ncbi:MAG TPA: FHA domain-containing protein, partial [Kofleriaceae bacterium]|nr:FHA domain-containing protein [Kofleriaceae bacterium]
ASRIPLPPVACDVLVDEPAELELLHCHAHERASTFAAPPLEHPGPPSAQAWLVCENGGRDGMVWDLGAFGTARIRIGRGIHGEVVIPSGSVARAHAALVWRDGAHVIHDMRSTNGTMIDGRRIDGDVALRDDTRFVLGQVILRYFTGPGAGARASACARRGATHEPITGLPRAARDEAAWLRIANIAELERHYGYNAGDAVIAELGRRLVAAAGDAELSAPQRNVFRVYPRERAQELAAACAGAVDHEGLMLDLRIEARAIG